MMFPSLKLLTLQHIQNLEEWSEAIEHGPLPSTTIFPCLEELNIWWCPKLTMLPSHFDSLKKLRIEDIDNSLALGKISSKLTSLTSLALVSIKGGSSEVNFVVEELLGNDTCLRELVLSSCEGLSYLPPNGLGNLVALEKLEVKCCRNLTSIPVELGTLKSLQV